MSAVEVALLRVGRGKSTAVDEELLRAALAQLMVKVVALMQEVDECLEGYKNLCEAQKYLGA